MNGEEGEGAESGTIRFAEADMCGGMYFKITERIQDLGTYIHHDVEAALRNSCAMFRTDLRNRSGRVKDVQKQTAQSMEKIASAVDTRLVKTTKETTPKKDCWGRYAQH